MKTKEMTKANLESVLLEFRVEAGKPGPAILEAYCRRYPQFARELTELYGGTLTLEDAPAGGLRARVELPALSSETTAARGTSGH